MFFRFTRALSVLLMVAGMAQPAATAAPVTVSKEEQLLLAQQVRELFEAKCLECHGPELPRPKGKFGYVHDLRRMAENPDYVVRGEPEKSELYLMCRDDEMPGEDANVPPLTPVEKETLRRWVEVGAPSDLPIPSEAVSAPMIEAPRPEMPLWKRTLRWIGRFHPLSTHFPVALMFVAVFAESLAWWTQREAWLGTVRFLVVLAALGAIAAAALGWVNAWFTSYVGEAAGILWWHRWLGTATAFWAGLCGALVLMSDCAEGTRERQTFRGALLVGALLVGISGFLGSALIYGLDHYNWN